MTREQVKEQFPDATDEQITAMLNINGTDLTEAKKNQIDKKELKRLQESDAAYKKLQDAGLTDEEKIQKALRDADDAKAEFAKKSNRLDAEKILLESGLSKKDYENLIDGIVSDDSEKTIALANNIASMVKSEKEAVEKHVKEELLDDMKTPGGDGGDGGDGDSEDVEFAGKVAASFNVKKEGTESVFDNY